MYGTLESFSRSSNFKVVSFANGFQHQGLDLFGHGNTPQGTPCFELVLNVLGDTPDKQEGLPSYDLSSLASCFDHVSFTLASDVLDVVYHHPPVPVL